MKITAILSPEFIAGNNKTTFAVDWIHLTHDEKKVIADFMKHVGEGVPLKGKNKPSWVNDDFEKLYGTDGYEQQNYWHYHCGPGWKLNTFRTMTIDLAFNPSGMHSYECIHYIKHSQNSITIVGYSRDHKPFPNSDFGKSPFFPDEA
ncbi:hypothetical protein [Pantoea ananatis]|uniref:hypothetical protein n=1 Tax=Pantoea ananas TaxID=553 RepID=UPI0024B6BF2D|nr:hypothetical protein [Pantoea ananatis]MDJ0030355.1 hypothetical protein [Pantoea ananatis]